MRLPDKQNSQISEIARRLAGLTHHLLSDLQPDGDTICLDSAANLLENQPATRLFLVKSGQLFCEHNKKLVFIVEPGDLIGFARSLQLPEGPYRADGPVELVPFQRDALMAHVNASEALQRHWAFFLISSSTFFRESLAQEIPGQFKPATGFLHFETGDTIINQGDDAECVYTMLEGSADALHDGVKVGEVHNEEIFGAIAVFTKQPRNATVIATSSCSVLAVRKDEFLDLVTHQPQICLSLVEEMAKKINQLNRQVHSLQKKT